LARKVPLNYLILLLFTVAEAYVVAFITTEYEARSVLIATGMTAAVTVALTFYALRTEHDFTIAGGALYVFAAVFAVIGFVLAICRVDQQGLLFLIYSAIAVILFGLYLIYDVQLIVGGGRYELDNEDYIIGALIVYLDIIMLFIHILELVGKRR
jgi:FtsH-binding integral membrane protein